MADSKDKSNSELNDDEVINRLIMGDKTEKKISDNYKIDKWREESSRIKKGEFDRIDVYNSVDADPDKDKNVFSKRSDIDDFYENVIELDANNDAVVETDGLVEDNFISETKSSGFETDSVAVDVVPDQVSEPIAIDASQIIQPFIAEINTQISKIWENNETLKQQIADLKVATSQDDSINEDIFNIQIAQNKLQRTIKKNEGMVPSLTYFSIGIAIVALLIGVGFGIIGLETKSNVNDLAKFLLVQQKGKVNLTTQESHLGMNELNDKMNLLIAKNEHLYKQLNVVTSSLQANVLKPAVNELQLQNQQTQETIEKLITKVETLEKGRRVRTTFIKHNPPVLAKMSWFVNLAALKQQWNAKKTAANFSQKGVPTEVVKVKVNGENWFRLRVKGFNSKQEALAYGIKVKKVLNLGAVWVSKS